MPTHQINYEDLSTAVNRRWVVAGRPEGREVRASDFRLEESPLPEPGPNQFVVRSLYLSASPVMRFYMLHDAGRAKRLELGETMRGRGVGVVVKSRSPMVAEGSIVHGPIGWQDYAVLSLYPKSLTFMVHQREAPLSTAIGALGMTGFSAYFGLSYIGRPKAGDTLVVSGAAGGVGSVVVPLAKIAGCRVIGVAGGPEKCHLVAETLGADACIDYRHEDVEMRLRELAPQGIDIYFDNVGGRVLDVCVGQIAQRGRIVMCGRISEYIDGPLPGLTNYHRVGEQNARMEGFFIYDYADRFHEAEAKMAHWIAEGRLPVVEDLLDGLERMPEALMRVYQRGNAGKQIVRVADLHSQAAPPEVIEALT